MVDTPTLVDAVISLLTAFGSFGGALLTIYIAFRLGVTPAQKRLAEAQDKLIEVLEKTNSALSERVTLLEAEVARLREERDQATTKAELLERRVTKLETLLADRLLQLGTDKLDELLDRLVGEERAA